MWNLNVGNFINNALFKSIVIRCCTTKPATPMMKSGDAGNGKDVYKRQAADCLHVNQTVSTGRKDFENNP